MRYDRDAAIGYARQYWDQPCDDGLFWRTDYPLHIDKMRKVLRAPSTRGGKRASFQMASGVSTPCFSAR